MTWHGSRTVLSAYLFIPCLVFLFLVAFCCLETTLKLMVWSAERNQSLKLSWSSFSTSSAIYSLNPIHPSPHATKFRRCAYSINQSTSIEQNGNHASQTQQTLHTATHNPKIIHVKCHSEPSRHIPRPRSIGFSPTKVIPLIRQVVFICDAYRVFGSSISKPAASTAVTYRISIESSLRRVACWFFAYVI